ncbi:hypothetical protein [Algoriphagus sp. A40]|uniref:hypothetical protein n=1 Tax=Algoriphagus sp. A40 TaxID=1945863 RepID=UPI0011155E71|nr:hypothetical protein [Algoriphagus sp. A40]
MNKTKFISAFLFMVFLGFAAQAQIPKVPNAGASALSTQVLGILDNTSGLNLSGDQSTKLKTNNKSFVDQLMKITGGSDSDDTKKSNILNLKNGRMKFLNELLGNELTQKYMGNVLKAINPLKSKLGLAALAF